MTHEWSIDELIENWRLAFKDRPQYSKTKSIEGGYKDPPISKEIKAYLEANGEVFETSTYTKPPINLKLAIDIEKSVIKLPMKYKLVLVCDTMYPYLLINQKFPRTCMAIGISRKKEVFDDYLKQSKIMLWNIFNKIHNI